jgi:hypothetical protein
MPIGRPFGTDPDTCCKFRLGAGDGGAEGMAMRPSFGSGDKIGLGREGKVLLGFIQTAGRI